MTTNIQQPTTEHVVPQAFYQLIPQLAAIMQLFSNMVGQHIERLVYQLHQFGDATDGQVSWMRIQSGAMLAFGFLGGVSGFAAALYPKHSDTPIQTPAQGLFEAIVQKLENNSFMRETFKTAAQVFPSIGSGVSTLFQSQTTQEEAKKTILSQARFSAAQEGQSSSQEAVRKANELGNQIIQLRAQGA